MRDESLLSRSYGTKPHSSSPPVSTTPATAEPFWDAGAHRVPTLAGHGPARKAWSMSLEATYTTLMTGFRLLRKVPPVLGGSSWPSKSGLRRPNPWLRQLPAASGNGENEACVVQVTSAWPAVGPELMRGPSRNRTYSATCVMGRVCEGGVTTTIGP